MMFFLIPFVIYAIPTTVGMLVISWLLKVKNRLECRLFSLCPILLWMAFTWHNDKGKTLGNAVAEPFLLAIIVCLLFAFRSFAVRRGVLAQKTLDAIAVGAYCLAAMFVFFLVPSLSE